MDHAISQQTLQRRRNVRLLTVAIVLAGLCAGAWALNRVVRPSVAARDIVVATLHRGDIANTIGAGGIVIPVHEALVPSPVQTRVAKVRAKPGQAVAQGELLLELDDATIRLAIDAIKEQLAQQENRILALHAEREQKRKQVAANIELLELDLQSARVRWERFQKLRASGAVSGEDMLTAELNVKRREIELRQQRELLTDNARATQSGIDAARLQKSILQKQLAQQEQLQRQAQVRAPFAGMLTWLLTDEGASVGAGQLVAKVSELNNYRVEASLSDFHANLLAAGQRVRIEQAGATLGGQLLTILPEVQAGTIKLLVALDQPNHPALRDKMRVDVNIVTGQQRNTLMVDAGPAFNGRGRQPGFVIRNGVAYKTTLDIGAGDGKSVAVVAGAVAGEQLIVSDIARFKDYDSIRISQ